MTKYKVKCPKCGQKLELNEENLKHRRAICPTCNNIFLVAELIENARRENSINDADAPKHFESSKEKFFFENAKKSEENQISFTDNQGTALANELLLNPQKLLRFLDSGKIIKITAGLALKVLATLLFTFSSIVWLLSWALILKMKFLAGVVFLIWQFAVLYSNYIWLRILYHRGTQIEKLPESNFVITPILSLYITTFGDASFASLIILSLPFGLMLGANVLSDFFTFINVTQSKAMSLLVGVIATVVLILFAYIIMFLSRLINEWLFAIFSIANDLSILKQNLTTEKK